MSRSLVVLDVGTVFTVDGRIRRIVSQFGGRITYSKGGDRNYCCAPRSFRRWVHSRGAVRVRFESPVAFDLPPSRGLRRARQDRSRGGQGMSIFTPKSIVGQRMGRWELLYRTMYEAAWQVRNDFPSLRREAELSRRLNRIHMLDLELLTRAQCLAAADSWCIYRSWMPRLAESLWHRSGRAHAGVRNLSRACELFVEADE